MEPCLVSIVVPVYKGEACIDETVASLLAQDYHHFELILVNDGSPDQSLRKLRALAERDSRIVVLDKPNGGVADARNHGIQAAAGELIAFCDQDDLWLPNKLSLQVPLFMKPEVGVVYSRASIEHRLYQSQKETAQERCHRGRVFDPLILDNFVVCCTAMARKSLIAQVGGLDPEKALMGVDDWHLWLKLAQVCEFDYVDQALATHIFHENNYSANDHKMHHAELVCLDKISKLAPKLNWPHILSNVHLRYAGCYVFNGEFKLAGRTYLQAHQQMRHWPSYLKGCFYTYLPTALLSGMQKMKRMKG